MFAILSDIHGNLEALHAVLRDIDKQSVDGILCLGDTVGYGPNPVECVELAMSWSLHLCGDLEWAIIEGLDAIDLYPVPLVQMHRWTRRQFDESADGENYVNWLRTLPRRHCDANTCYVHGSPRGELHDFIFPEDVYCEARLDAIANHFASLCFCGSSHIAGVFTRQSDGWQYFEPHECDNRYPIEEDKTIITVGSVGQPRDGDPRASYVLYDGHAVQFRRVEYDFNTTCRKIHDLPGLDNVQGDRLSAGR
jgi:diadenosine tetraphosphatase ApaH/serine/threonine PP2A family protein phosphatase